MNNKATILIAIVLAIVATAYSAAFIVDETEQVVLTRFGKIVREPITTPGLNFRIPFIDTVNKYPKNLQQWDGDPGQIPTKDKTFIWVDSFARWKITDPVRFRETVGDVRSANSRLNDIIDPAVRNAVTSYRLIETVRSSNRELDTFEEGFDAADGGQQRQSYGITTGRGKITDSILTEAQPKLVKFGIEVVDVQVKRVNYVDQVRESVYNRMIAERKQIAEKFRSEGEGEARKIRGDKERDLKEINSEAYRQSQIIKGKADAEATRIYADAFGVDPEFYTFVKTLEVYSESIGNDSALVLSTDSDLLKYLKAFPKSLE
ncbi:MAG: protease modulator HflC [Desulfobacterales bacterium]|nr:protease modulator HflC [Desulfobacterales bacterium]